MNLHIRRGFVRVNGGIVAHTPFFAVRQRGYSKLLQQIFVQNIRVFMQFRNMLKELEKRKPYIAPSSIGKVPTALEFCGPRQRQRKIC